MAEVDKTGLDILCRADGGTYMPPKGGISVCLFKDGTIVVCDSKEDKCSRAVPEGSDRAPHAEGMLTFRLLKILKELNDRVERLEAKIAGSKR